VVRNTAHRHIQSTTCIQLPIYFHHVYGTRLTVHYNTAEKTNDSFENESTLTVRPGFATAHRLHTKHPALTSMPFSQPVHPIPCLRSQGGNSEGNDRLRAAAIRLAPANTNALLLDSSELFPRPARWQQSRIARNESRSPSASTRAPRPSVKASGWPEQAM
jgi:hypothetical protein